jgi:hypothetical protein
MLATLALTLAGAAWWWLHRPHTPTEAIATAQAFVQDVQQGDYPSAWARTLGSTATGTTPAELGARASRQLCTPARVAYSLPLQSHGNRLRRWMAGREVDGPQVRVEFTGSPCLFGITLQRTGPGQWRVAHFASHAG